jgi:hypothetical protein
MIKSIERQNKASWNAHIISYHTDVKREINNEKVQIRYTLSV